MVKPKGAPRSGLHFIAFMMGALVTICRRGKLLGTSVSDTAGTRHLNTGRTPPTVVSSFLKGRLSRMLSRVRGDAGSGLVDLDNGRKVGLSVPRVPRLLVSGASHGHASPFTFAKGHFRFHTMNSRTGYTSTVVTLGSTMTSRLTGFGGSISTLVRGKRPGISTVLRVVHKCVGRYGTVRFSNGNCDSR